MAYRLPNFNLTVNVWRHGVPITNPPTLTTPGNLRGVAKGAIYDLASTSTVFYWELLVPRLTDIRGIFHTTGSDVIECPAGSGRHYTVIWVDDVAKGFANEYRLAMIVVKVPWPTPTP